jgi:hypothetical protein
LTQEWTLNPISEDRTLLSYLSKRHRGKKKSRESREEKGERREEGREGGKR